MKINGKKIMAVVLTLTLVAGNVGMAAVNVLADDDSKEEVIYVSTTANGTVESVNAVNIFGKGNITDYGNYSNVKMLNSTEIINKDGDKITFSTDKDKVYYQGTMENAEIPWNIKITYSLDGKEMEPEELAGKSGSLTINIKIKKNQKSETDFYNDYALQASLTLDMEKCENIKAEGATLANVGANKQISYTVLPGKGLDAEITADVKDFEMDAVAVNAVKLNLDIDIDDKELMDKVKELMNASKDINNGASKLSDGTDSLKKGSSDLLDGADSLNSGADKLDSGIVTLDNGVATMEKALDKLNKKSKTLTGGSDKILTALKTIQKQLSTVFFSTTQLKQLTDSSAEIKKGIDDAYNGAVTLQKSLSYDTYKSTLKLKGLDIDQLKSSNDATIEKLSAQIGELSSSVNQIKSIPGYENNETYKANVKELEDQIASLKNIVTLLKGNNGAIAGTEQYFTTTENGAMELVKGLKKLKTGHETFNKSIVKLAGNLSDLAVNVSTLKSAIDKLVTSYGTLDKGISDYTEGVASIVTAYSKISKGTQTLVTGGKDLVKGTSTLKKGTLNLYNGVASLGDGAKELNDGTGELYNQTQGMDTKIEDEIDNMLDSMSGKNSETKSFTSDKNKNARSVQFVIKTTAIEKPEQTKTTTESNKKLNFWEKLLKLFGI